MDEIELKGFARYSPRLWLLKRLAGSDDPILHVTAMSLLRDRVAYKIGGFHEFVFIVLLPIFAVLISVSEILIDPYTYSYSPGVRPLSAIIMVISASLSFLSGILIILAYLNSFLLLVHPCVTLLKREPDGNLFRFLSLKPSEIFKSMIKLQLISYLLPIVFSYLVDLLLGFALFITYQLRDPQSTMSSATSFSIAFTFIEISILIFITFASIHAGFKFRQQWSAFLGLCGSFLVCIIVSWIAMGVKLSTSGILFSFHGYSIFIGTTVTVASILVMAAIAVFLAFLAISAYVKPGK